MAQIRITGEDAEPGDIRPDGFIWVGIYGGGIWPVRSGEIWVATDALPLYVAYGCDIASNDGDLSTVYRA